MTTAPTTAMMVMESMQIVATKQFISILYIRCHIHLRLIIFANMMCIIHTLV